jgi:hypothetical protein
MMFIVGEKVKLDQRWNGRQSIHTITKMHDNKVGIPVKGMFCQSGVLVQVDPALSELKPDSWIDIGWFKTDPSF